MSPLQSTAAVCHENQNRILTCHEGRRQTGATRLTAKRYQGREVLSFQSAARVSNREHFGRLPPSGVAPGKSDDDVEAVLLLAFNAAVTLARSGDCQSARQSWAAIILEAQPLIVAREKLLRAMLHALFVVQAFRLLARVVMAVSGTSIVEVTVSTNSTKEIEQPRSDLKSRRIRLFLDSRWLDRLSPDDLFLRDWCDVLFARREVEEPTDAGVRRRDKCNL
jgi:hypothetical protein